jgi:hypothetical protein
MENTNIKKASLLICFIILSTLCTKAQPVMIEPGNANVKPELVYTGDFTLESNKRNVMTYVNLQRNAKEITLKIKTVTDGVQDWQHEIVYNAKTFELIKDEMKDEDRMYDLKFESNKIKGSATNFESNKKENIATEVQQRAFNTTAIPYIISTLPLSLTYRVTIPVMRFNEKWQPAYYRYKITKVEEYSVFSCLSGYHNIWKVTVEEKTNNHTWVILIDKETRRIYRTEQSFDGMHLSHNQVILKDMEAEVNPIKAKFDAKETNAMLTAGTSSIEGQASTKISEKKLEGNKTQYAPKGSLVVLFPQTAYFKEWVKFNLYAGNIQRPVYWEGRLLEGCSYPLPKEVSDNIAITEVYDDKGRFAFKNLKPGEYLVYVSYVANKYTHTTKTPNGYVATISSDGTSANVTQTYDIKHWMSPETITTSKNIIIKKDGEEIKIQLK